MTAAYYGTLRDRWRGMTFRVGRSVGRTIYLQREVEPSAADSIIGLMDSVEYAALVVAALNEYVSERG